MTVKKHCLYISYLESLLELSIRNQSRHRHLWMNGIHFFFLQTRDHFVLKREILFFHCVGKISFAQFYILLRNVFLVKRWVPLLSCIVKNHIRDNLKRYNNQ